MTTSDRQVETDAPVGVILNPAAGRKRALGLLPTIANDLRRLGRRSLIHVTTRPGEAVTVSQQLAEEHVSVLIAVGGDGTVNEIVTGLDRLRLNKPLLVPLGLISAGRGGDFHRSLDIAPDPRQALQDAINGSPRAIDLGRITLDSGQQYVFANVAGVGFDAAVAHRTHRSHLPGSTLPYLTGTVAGLLHYRNTEVTITSGDWQHTGRVRMVIISNGKTFGGGMRIAPLADLTDGLLDLAVIGDVSAPALMRAMPSVYRGNHLDHPDYFGTTVRQARIEPSVPLPAHVDGEPIASSPMTVTVDPGALLIIR